MLLQTYKLTTGSSDSNAQHKALCLRDEKKNLLHLPKEKANFSKIGEGAFSVENLGLFFQS